MLEKTYQPADIEARIHEEWMKAEAFKAGRPERAKAEPYCIVIPPPNVTGSLHWGHALNNTLQDVLCRFERMRGKDVLWQPGTDHAGIATQMVVERQLMERQQGDRHKLGREKFIEKVWAWKAESGGVIINQLKRLGASCDWSRERFTMGERGAPDEQMVRAVTKVFVDLYNEGLIYKDKRLANWDPEFQTALSNLEVEMVDAKGSFSWTAGDPDKPFDAKALGKVLARNPNGHLYHFRYPLKDDPSRFIVVATTRPETMLGDTAVAVHPDDRRYKDLVGKTVVLPLVGREIPIIADDYADPEKGSGAVKITPAHDFNDYRVYQRHPEIGIINIFDATAHLNDEAPPKYRKMDRLTARRCVVEDLEAQGLVEKIESTVHAVPHAQRGNAVIEPWLTDQWYVNAAELAKRAMAVVEEGKTQFVPKNWEKTYFEWMRNIEPWCISRQIWWGHQIPAWYGAALLPHPDVDTSKNFVGSFVFVAASEKEAIAQAKKAYNTTALGDLGIDVEIGQDVDEMNQSWADYKAGRSKKVKIWRDPDVLDTWFSSALWPFSTLGWPDKTPELKRYYPTSTLVTAFDIIFFWVARMMMMGMHFMKEVPFHTVYIHAIVRDEQGAKMSKSKGNVADPLQVIDEYGADAFRFTLAAMAAQGRDIRVSQQRIEGYRNFATKLWNAARFGEMNECVRQKGFRPQGRRGDAQPLDRRRGRAHGGRRHGRHRGLQVQRGGHRHLRVHLGHLLRLVSGAGQAHPQRRGRAGQGRDARHRRLGARPDPEAAASLHAVHHRGAVGAPGRGGGRAPEPALPLDLAGVRGSGRRRCRRGDRLARQARQRGALGALGDERAGRRQDPAGARRRQQGDARARRSSRGHDQAAGQARCDIVRQGAAQGLGADRAGRDHRGPAARRRHRHGRRAGAADARDREG